MDVYSVNCSFCSINVHTNICQILRGALAELKNHQIPMAWGRKFIKFQWRQSEAAAQASFFSPARRAGAARFTQTHVFNFKKQRRPFGNFFPKIAVRVAAKNLGLIALTVAEISAFKILTKLLGLFNIFQNLQKVFKNVEKRKSDARSQMMIISIGVIGLLAAHSNLTG